MSTRSQIGFYEAKDLPFNKREALLYRHSDGYPSGVLPEIIPFLKWWKGQRGISDLEYCSVRLAQYLCNLHDGITKEINKDLTGKTTDMLGKNTDFTGIYGYGISKNFHGDIEYFYYIYPNGVVVYSGCGVPKATWKIVSDINLDMISNSFITIEGEKIELEVV